MRRAAAPACSSAKTALISASGRCSTKGSEGDLAGEHQLDHGRVVLGQAAPVALGRGVEGHQVGQPQLDGPRGEADHAQVAAVAQQAEGRGLAGRRAGGLEDARAPSRDAVRLGELPQPLAQALAVQGAGIESQRRRRGTPSARGAVRCTSMATTWAPSAAAICTPKPPTPPTPTKTARSPCCRPLRSDGLVGRRDRVGHDREGRQIEPGRGASQVGDRAEAARRARARGWRSRRARRCPGRPGAGRSGPDRPGRPRTRRTAARRARPPAGPARIRLRGRPRPPCR